jgi:flavin-dependent dehydrogenase
MEKVADYDVIIIGAGLAGLTLSRQLLLETDKRILLIDRRDVIPPGKQKVGESLVQVGGYYFGKVLDLEEHLFCEHLMKYNLRFYWASANKENRNFEDFGQSYIRSFSNIPCYQLDRNKIEAELLRCNQMDSRFEFISSISNLDVELSDNDVHTVAFDRDGNSASWTAHWVVDTSGRRKILANQLGLIEENNVHHGASFFWVDGLIDIEKLTEKSLRDRRLNTNRKETGHLPLWLATNHFMGEGFWFWVIPLQGKTSLGLVYDNQLISHNDVSTPEKLIDWVCERFPLFERDLPNRKVIDHSSFKSFSYGCKQTISSSRWALSGESGRFADPLYSPGSDFIAFHNTLIVDAIRTTNAQELAGKCNFYELTVRSIYESLLPTYGISYDALGDQEAFSIKYTWELSVYFSFFVFPFINDLSTDKRFVLSFFKQFSVLGPINKNLQQFISAFYQWKKKEGHQLSEPLLHDFTRVRPLQTAADTFYKVGISVEDARIVLSDQVENLTELARFFVAYMCSIIFEDKHILTNKSFVESIDLEHLKFDLEALEARYHSSIHETARYEWSFDCEGLELFRAASGNLKENLMLP